MEKQTTNEILAASFKELVLEEPIEKITIKEITDRAGVIRPTFYNHFQDKYDLLEWIIREELLKPVIPLIQGGFMKEAMALIFSNMQKEKEFYIKAAHLEGQNSFSYIVQSYIEKTIYQYIAQTAGENSRYRNWIPAQMVAEYYARCIRFLTIKWTLDGMQIPPMELAGICNSILESNIEEIVHEMK